MQGVTLDCPGFLRQDELAIASGVAGASRSPFVMRGEWTCLCQVHKLLCFKFSTSALNAVSSPSGVSPTIVVSSAHLTMTVVQFGDKDVWD